MKVLKDLTKSDWEEFKMYIGSTKEKCRDWLTKSIHSEYFTEKDTDGKNRYQRSAENHLGKIMFSVRESINKARKKNVTSCAAEISLVDWLNTFRSEEKTVGFAASDFSTMTLTSSTSVIKDVEEFTKYVEKKINECERRMKDHFEQVNSLDNHKTTVLMNHKSPFDKAFDAMWGCDEQCPFCREFCRLGETHQEKNHECLQHRPEGINGAHWEGSLKLVTENCSWQVHSGYKFYCRVRCRKKNLCTLMSECKEMHDYPKYDTYFTDWSIPGTSDKTEKTLFWAFMMNKYAKELSQWYGTELPDMPASWATITLEQAKESLDRLTTGSI